MFGAIARKIFGTANERYLKGLYKTVDAINALEAELEPLSNEELAARTVWFRERLDAGETLDDLLVEAFATVREAAKRTLGQRHYDVQLLGGMILHNGMIAEMKTGEGKTLVATLAVYLNALNGRGVHVVTVNDYLAQRDSGWMGQVYRFLGLTTATIIHGMGDEERKEAYSSDVIYATNNELGFDYLRDNMKFRMDDMVQRDFAFAIVDEVDSILIDEARTPLIISGPTDDNSELYVAIDKLIPHLTEDDFEKDEKARAVTFTEDGVEHIEQLMQEAGLLTEGNMFDYQNISLQHHANQALRAHKLFQRDTDYIVKDGQVMIIDEFTGRIMDGRRYSEGLHQALEAKEGVKIENENQTLASITYQNYFRLYEKLSGMTGTAMTEAGEFSEIYNLEVVEIPTNVPCVRIDEDDQVYRTIAEKDNAILELVREANEHKQPVLVGTVSIEKSEHLSKLFKKAKIKHNVLNARHHEQEAQIVADAGMPGAVTIATNMAGRGTDIQLGGNFDMRFEKESAGITDEGKLEALKEKIKAEIERNREIVVDAGGLYIIGTERHESRRIDNQLRGRAGRQGDRGASSFFLSLEDDLMRIFGSDRIDGMLKKLGLEEGEAITHPWVNKALEKAQQKVEAHHFEARKHVLKFDDVMNDQRKVIYEQRKELMSTEDVSEEVLDMRASVIDDLITQCIPEKAYAEQWDVDTLHEEVLRLFGLDLEIADWAKEEGIADQEIRDRIKDRVDRAMASKVARYTPEVWRSVEKSLLLQILDEIWKDHLLSLDHLRQGIGLRAYGQKDPLNEYKREAFNMFEEMLDHLREKVVQFLAHVEIQTDAGEDMFQREQQEMHEGYEDPAFANATGQQQIDSSTATQTIVSRSAAENVNPNDPSTWGRVPRNSPCPCGSGSKFKHCHGKVA